MKNRKFFVEKQKAQTNSVCVYKLIESLVLYRVVQMVRTVEVQQRRVLLPSGRQRSAAELNIRPWIADTQVDYLDYYRMCV